MGDNTYLVETERKGFIVKVSRPNGAVYLTSPALPSLTETRRWIDEHVMSETRPLRELEAVPMMRVDVDRQRA